MTHTPPTTHSGDLLKKDIDSFIGFLTELKKEATGSSELLEMGVKDGLAQKLEEIRQQPLESLFEIYAKVERDIAYFIHQVAFAFLQKEKERMAQVFQHDAQGGALQFSVVLKEDANENRDVFYDFLDDYSQFSFSERFPIIFHFVPENLVPELATAKELKLD